MPGNDVDTKFLYYNLLSRVEELNRLGTGATFLELSATRLKSVEIPLPPLAEQKRIVAILDEAFEAIGRAENLRRCATEPSLSLLTRVIDTVFAEIDANETECLDDLRLPGRVITYGVIKLGNHIEGGVPCLRTSNVRRLELELEGMKCISRDLSESYSRTILKGGELLVAVRGSLGGVAVVPDTLAGANVSREVAVVAIDSDRVLPNFVAYAVATTTSQKWLTGVLKGVAYTGINIADLRKLRIPVPSMTVQRQVIGHLDAIKGQGELLSTAQSRKESLLRELRQALLAQAFSGDLLSGAAIEAEAVTT